MYLAAFAFLFSLRFIRFVFSNLYTPMVGWLSYIIETSAFTCNRYLLFFNLSFKMGLYFGTGLGMHRYFSLRYTYNSGRWCLDGV